MADGTVVEVSTDANEAHDRLQRPGESAKDFEMRTIAAQNELLAKSYKAPLGNYVVLRHAGGEHSHYVHLKQGSVKVKAGDTVKRGQVDRPARPHRQQHRAPPPLPAHRRPGPAVLAEPADRLQGSLRGRARLRGAASSERVGRDGEVRRGGSEGRPDKRRPSAGHRSDECVVDRMTSKHRFRMLLDNAQ